MLLLHTLSRQATILSRAHQTSNNSCPVRICVDNDTLLLPCLSVSAGISNNELQRADGSACLWGKVWPCADSLIPTAGLGG